MSEIDLDELGRIKAIEYFETIKDFVPLDSNGKPDISKLKEKLINLDMNQPSSKFIVSVFPEFFARGRGSLWSYYVFCAPEGSSIEDLFKGDFSFLERYEKDFPLIQRIAFFLYNNRESTRDDCIHRVINSTIIEDTEFMRDIVGDDVDKYPEVLKQVAKNSHILIGNEDIDSSSLREKLVDDKDNEYLQFCLRVLEFNDCLDHDELWEEKKIWEKMKSVTSDELDRIDKDMISLQEELEMVQERLGRGKGWLKAFFARLKTGYDADKKNEEQLKKVIEDKINAKEIIQGRLDSIIERNRLMDLYQEKYRDRVIQFVNPYLKQVLVKDSDSDEDKKKICQMIDRFIEHFYSVEENKNRSFNVAISCLDNLIDKGKKRPVTWDEHISRFYNPIITTSKISQAFLEFEKLENKDIFSIMQVIRKTFEGIPSDFDHDIPEKGYRKISFKNSLSAFLKAAPPPEKIEEELVSLNILLQQVLNETDLEQYIRGAHYVFSELAHIHPFTDGNGRLVKYLIRILLAHRGIIAPAFYKEIPSRDRQDRGYVKFILENSLDITGCDRLHQKEEVMENENIDTSGYGI